MTTPTCPTRPSRAGRRIGLGAATCCLAAVGAVLPSTANAIPGDGAGPDTPGTSASVSPRTLSAGSLIRFTVAGFPAGEVVNIKIDDGNFCSDRGVHGACVVHMQRIGGNGTAAGSFQLPADLKPGKHWLRFLASQQMRDAQGNNLGVKGFTRRGGAEFTVVTGGSNTAPPTPGGHGGTGGQGGTGSAPHQTTTGVPTPNGTTTSGPFGAPSAGGTSAPGPTVAPAGVPVPVALPSTAAATTGPTPTGADSTPTGSAVPSDARAVSAIPAQRYVPWWGIGSLVLLLALAGATALLRRPTRG